MSEPIPNSAFANNRRWLLVTLAVLVFVAVAVFAGYYAVRRAEAQVALRYYQIALEYHDASSVNDPFLSEMSAQALEAQLRVPFASFDQAVAEHVARIEAMRDKYIAQLPGINQRVSHLGALDALVADAREWQRSGKRPVHEPVEDPLLPEIPPPSE